MMRLRLWFALLVFLLLGGISGCSEDGTMEGHYEEVCALCGATWKLTVQRDGGQLRVTVDLENTGELGPLEISSDTGAVAILFNQAEKAAWLKDYPQAYVDRTTSTARLARVSLTPTAETTLPATVDPGSSWRGTYVAGGVPPGTEAAIIAFSSFFVRERMSEPAAWTSRDERRPFINFGKEIVVTPVVPSTPKPGSRTVTPLPSVLRSTGQSPTVVFVGYRFSIEPRVEGVDRVQLRALPDEAGADVEAADFSLSRSAEASVLTVWIPASQAPQHYLLIVWYPDGGTNSIEFTHPR
jgi:hypothetical protein